MSETDLRNWNEKIEDRVTKLEQENQRLRDKFTSLNGEIDLMETQDTSPEHDEGFADCQRQVLNLLDEWLDF